MPHSITRGYSCIGLSPVFLFMLCICKLEDLKVLRRSPDLFNNVKIGQCQLRLIIEHILFYHILGFQPFGPVT